MLRGFEKEEDEETARKDAEGWKDKQLYTFYDRFVKKIIQRTQIYFQFCHPQTKWCGSRVNVITDLITISV